MSRLPLIFITVSLSWQLACPSRIMLCKIRSSPNGDNVYKLGETIKTKGCVEIYCGKDGMRSRRKANCTVTYHQKHHHVRHKRDAESVATTTSQATTEKHGCPFEGKWYKKGEMKRENCQIFYCTNVGPRAVYDPNQPGCSLTTTPEMTTRRHGCRFEGEWYKKGEMKRENCQIFYCTDVGPRAVYDPNQPGCSLTTTQEMTTRRHRCWFEGKSYHEGEMLRENCQIFYCTDVGPRAVHDPNQPGCSLTTTPEMTTRRHGCWFQGKWYKKGEMKRAECQIFYCTDFGPRAIWDIRQGPKCVVG